MFFLLKYQVITYYNRLKAHWKLYREQSRYWKLRRKSVATLKRIDNREIPTNQDEIRLFVHIRNESLRLPYFIEYYQKSGVNRFFFIDNDSTDDSLQLALAVVNGHVFSTKDEFKNHHYWREHFLDRYGKGHWCVVVDVDELFFYPHIERVSLKDLCSFLDSRQTTAIRALFLDLYADTSVAETIYRQGENPLEVVRFFDSSYQFTFR